MDAQPNDTKLVIIVNSELGIGLASNTAAVLSLSIGAKYPELIGADLVDGDGQKHLGITTIPIPILSTDAAKLTEVVQKVRDSDIELVSFTNIAQSIHSYDEYAQKLSATSGNDIVYSGIALFGPTKSVNSLAGSLPRLKA